MTLIEEDSAQRYAVSTFSVDGKNAGANSLLDTSPVVLHFPNPNGSDTRKMQNNRTITIPSAADLFGIPPSDISSTKSNKSPEDLSSFPHNVRTVYQLLHGATGDGVSYSASDVAGMLGMTEEEVLDLEDHAKELLRQRLGVGADKITTKGSRVAPIFDQQLADRQIVASSSILDGSVKISRKKSGKVADLSVKEVPTPLKVIDRITRRIEKIAHLIERNENLNALIGTPGGPQRYTYRVIDLPVSERIRRIRLGNGRKETVKKRIEALQKKRVQLGGKLENARSAIASQKTQDHAQETLERYRKARASQKMVPRRSAIDLVVTIDDGGRKTIKRVNGEKNAVVVFREKGKSALRPFTWADVRDFPYEEERLLTLLHGFDGGGLRSLGDAAHFMDISVEKAERIKEKAYDRIRQMQ